MNSDQVIGALKELAGGLQEYTGRFLGNLHQENLGYELEYEGISQRHRGEAKEAFEDLLKNRFQA